MKKSLFLIPFLILFLLIPLVSAHTITVPTNAYFGIPTYGTYINFNTQQTFDDIYRESNTWNFNTSTNKLYQFNIQTSNMTITKLFDQNYLDFTTDASPTISINPSNAGYNYEPRNVEYTGQGLLSYSWGGGTLTITNTASGSYHIDWSPISGGPGGVGGYIPTKTNTLITVLPFYSNFTSVAETKTKIEGYLKTSGGINIQNKTILMTSDFGVSVNNKTNSDGYFNITFTSPKYNGTYRVQLNFNGDDMYNPSMLNIPLTVYGGTQPPVYTFNIFVFLGALLIVVAVLFVVGSWLQQQKR